MILGNLERPLAQLYPYRLPIAIVTLRDEFRGADEFHFGNGVLFATAPLGSG